MDSIIKSFNQIDEPMLKNLICTVELITYQNIFKELGGNIKSRVNKNINTESIEFKSQRLLDELNSLDKPALLLRLIRSIEDKLSSENYSPDDKFNIHKLDDALLESACKSYNIDKNKSYKEKIHLIKIAFESELKSLSKKYQEMDESDLYQMEQAIEEELDNLSEREIEALKNQLNVEDLSGSAIKEVLTKTGGALTLMMIPTLAGFSSYIFLTTAMHAVFTTLLGITLPFAAYTTTTTVVSILAGPVGWIGIAGFTVFQLRKNRKKLTQAIMAQVVGIAALYNETEEERFSTLPDWLSRNKKNELLDLKLELDSARQELNELYDIKSKNETDLVSHNNKVSELQKEIKTLDSFLKEFQQAGDEQREYLERIKRKRFEQLEEYKKKEEAAKELVNLGNTTNIHIRGLITSISKVIHSVNDNERKGNEGEHIVYLRLLESLPSNSYALLQPQIGEKYPDIIVIHPHKGFRIVEVKNFNLNSIRHVQSNGLLKSGPYKASSNPLGQARAHSEELYGYLRSNYPELGDMYRSIGYCVIHIGFTRRDFIKKFGNLINNWDDAQKSNFFKYHMFEDQLSNPTIDKDLWNAAKYKNETINIPEKKIVDIAMSININPYFELK